MRKITLKITKQITLFCSLMLVFFASAQTFDVTFNVDMTNESVEPEGVFVGGGFIGNANTSK